MERRLGRGLGSLLGASPSLDVQKGSREVPLDQIRPNPHQPRKTFDPAALEELAHSIQRHGVLQPIVVRPAGSGFEIVSGERRWRASRAAGRITVPALVRDDVTDAQMLELALVENLQRQDLDALERARGYRDMMDSLRITQEEVAEKVGLKRATVANHLRLLDLPEVAQDALRKGLITMGHARALLGLAEPRHMGSLVARIAREDLSVREVERVVRESAQTSKDKAPSTLQPIAPQPAWARELELRMREHLGTKVQLHPLPGYRGTIVIEYFDRADLDRLAAILAPRESL